MGGSARTAVVPVNMVNVETDTVGDDQFSPGVGWHVLLYRRNCDNMTYWERLELLVGHSDSSEDCGCGPPGDFDLYDPRDYEVEIMKNDAEEAEGY